MKLEGAEGTLPVPRTPLLGRGAELDALGRLVRGARLVTVVGQGGAGKTRVAIETASRADREVLAFVDCSAVTDDRDVLPQLARLLGLTSGRRDPLDVVATAVGPRDVLVVVDNMEHVLPAACALARLLERCPGLYVLATSRAPLRVDGEHVWRLDPLPVPAAGATIDELLGCPSVALLVERVAAVRPGFALAPANANAVAELCRRFDGLPLALELCAARLTTLSPAALLDRFDRDGTVGLLDRGPHDRPRRHQTLRAAIAWTHDLLSDADRVLLRRMSVFTAPPSLDALEDVCASDELRRDAILDALADLVDFNLVVSDDESRFRLHAAIAEFAREQLRVSGEEEPTFDRLEAYVTELGGAARVGLESDQELAWLARLEREAPDIGVVFERSEPHPALELAVDLGAFWLHRGRLDEGRRRLRDGLRALGGGASDDLRIAAMLWDARLAVDLGDVGEADAEHAARANAEAALALARASGERHAELHGLDVLSHVLTFEDDAAHAARVTDEGIALARELDDGRRLAELLQRAAFLADQCGDQEAAARMAHEGHAVATRIGAQRLALYNAVTLAQLDIGVVPLSISELVALAAEVRDQRWIGIVGAIAGTDAFLHGELTAAARHYERGLYAARDASYRQATGFCMMGAVGVAVLRGDARTAASLHSALRPHLPFLRRGLPSRHYATYCELVAGLDEGSDDPVPAWTEAIAASGAYLARIGAEDAVPGAKPGSRNVELTERELEVLRLIASGATNKEIATELHVAPKTVMHHSSSIYRKLGVRGRAEATAAAFRRGLVTTARQ